MTAPGSRQARRRALAFILHPLEVAAMGVAIVAPLWPGQALLGFGIAAGLGAAGAALRRHWLSVTCWMGVGAWLLAGEA